MHLLPATPEIYLELQSLLDENMPPIKQIIKTILSDPALTLRVLSKVTMTKHFDPRNSTITVAKVINFIGLNPLREMLNSRVVFHDELDLKNQTLFDLHAFWKHSLFAAFAAERLASELRYPNPEEAYIAALIHDIGKLAIARFSPDKSFKINKIHRNPSDYAKAEEKILRLKHQELGGEISESLRMPESISNAVFRHHDDRMLMRYKNLEKSLNLIVFVANTISKIFCYREHANHYFYEGQEDANIFIDMSHTVYRRLVRQVGDRIYGLIDDFHTRSEGLRHYCINLEEACKSANKQAKKIDDMQHLLNLREVELKVLEELIPRLSKKAELESLVLTLAKSISTYATIKYTALFLYEHRTRTLINKVHFGLPPDDPMRWATFDPKESNGVIAASFAEKKSYNIKNYNDSLGDAYYSIEELRYVKNFPFATIPVLKSDEPIGVLYVSHAQPNQAIRTDEFEMFQKLCRYVSRALA